MLIISALKNHSTDWFYINCGQTIKDLFVAHMMHGVRIVVDLRTAVSR